MNFSFVSSFSHTAWWGLQSVVLAVIIYIGAPYSDSNAQVPLSINVDVAKITEQVTNLLRELKTNGSVHRSFSSAVSKVVPDSKLVVATLEIPVTCYKEVQNAIPAVGTVGWQLTVVEAPSNRVQFYIPIEKITKQNISIEPEKLALQVVVPRPILDEPMIVIDRDKMKGSSVKGGPGPLPDYKIQEIREDLKDNAVKEAVLAQAKSTVNLQAVSDAGKRAVEHLFQKVLANDQIFSQMLWLRIQVLYEDEVDASIE